MPAYTEPLPDSAVCLGTANDAAARLMQGLCLATQVNGGVQLWCLQPCSSSNTNWATDQIALRAPKRLGNEPDGEERTDREVDQGSTMDNAICSDKEYTAMERRRSLYPHKIQGNAEQVEGNGGPLIQVGRS